MISRAQSEPLPESLAAAIQTRPTLFRNNRLFLAGTLLLSILFSFLFLCSLVLMLGCLGELLPVSIDSIFCMLSSAVMTLSCALMSVWLFNQTRLMAYAHAQLSAAGIEFCYGTKRSPRRLFFPWAEITSIYHWRLPQGQAYRVETSRENFVEFSSYTFFRPGKLAALIAGRTGCAIERIAK